MMATRILLPTDLGAQSERAARVARNLGQAWEAVVDVLHVPEPVELAIPAPEIGALLRRFPPDRAAVEARLRAFVRRRLTGVRTRIVITDGRDPPARQITRYARDVQSELIIVGTRPRGWLARLIARSVSDAVLRSAPCPVLMVAATARTRAAVRYRARKLLAGLTSWCRTLTSATPAGPAHACD